MSPFTLASPPSTLPPSPTSTEEEDPATTLPFPPPLPRTDFLAPNFTPSHYLSTLFLSGGHRHQSLPDLTSDLRARSQLLNAFGHLPIGMIDPNEVQRWLSQLGADGYDHSTVRAKRSLLRSILRVAVDQGWLLQNVVDATRLPRAVCPFRSASSSSL